MIDLRGLLNAGMDAFGRTSSEKWNQLVRAVMELQKRAGGSSSASGDGAGGSSSQGGSTTNVTNADYATQAGYAKKAGESDYAKLADKATDVSTNSPAYNRWLRKDKDDTANGVVGFLKGFWVKTKGLFGIDEGGNADLNCVNVRSTAFVEGETILKQITTVGDFERDVQVGIGSLQGVRMLPDGSIIARSLELSESLMVPTIKYNSIEVLSGTRWDSAGKGRVKEVISTDDETHTCTFVLDLNNGEPGEFVAGDILRGFWHNMDGTKNAAANADDRHGNIQRAGFQSIYCRVLTVGDIVERVVDDVTYYVARDNNYVAQIDDRVLANGLVTVQVRQFSTSPERWSPYPEQWSVLSVSGSFDTSHPERQNFFIYTTSYMARYEGVNTWEWEDHNLMGAWGDLTGFTMLELDSNNDIVYRKEFSGEGFITKDAHIYGVLDQFTRFSDKLEIRLSRADGTIADGEQLRADFVLKDIEGTVINSGYTFTITRQSGNATTDAAWNAAKATAYPDGIPASLYFTFADIPETGAVFVVAASRQVSDGNGGTDTYTTSASFVLTRAYAEEDFQGPWSSLTTYTRTSRLYPTVTHGGCKWYLKVATSTNDEPHPLSNVWGMVYGINDLEIRFYNESGQRIYNAQQYPGYVSLYLEPRLLCGNYDITDSLQDSDWTWERYTGNYGEATDTRSASDKQADQGWPAQHWPSTAMTRILRLTNDDMPPTWGSGPIVNFIITAHYDGLDIPNIITM